MTLNERLEFCKICQNRKVDFHAGLTCALTNEKPDFEESCKDFVKDEKEAERKLKLKLDAAGNSRSQNGSLNPEKNIRYGVFLIAAGIFILIFISLLFGVILLITGVSFMMRGKQQEKILKKEKELNDKINNHQP